MHRLFVLPLGFDVLHGGEILLRPLMNDLFDALEVLLVFFGFLYVLELVVGGGLIA